ncbi:hypothetical protein ABT096_29785 [Streptomyces sp. NPDC002561]|uniref:hypothetical protein n=1 Tax=Streptomyces sp. NPDC002561 TaxID=3154418 RepID=UPI003324B7AC
MTVSAAGLAAGGAVVTDSVAFGPPNSASGNLIPYAASSVELDVSAWGAWENCTIAQSSTLSWEGWCSLAITSAASGEAQSGISVPIAITAGTEYVSTVMVRSAVAGSVRVDLRFYNAAGTFLSWAFSTWSLAADTWTRLTAAGYAPAGAVGARIVVRPMATAAGQIWFCDRMTISPALKLPNEMLSYNASSFEVDASAWLATDGCTISRSLDTSWEGVASLRVDPVGASTSGTFQLVQPLPVTPRQAYQVEPRVKIGADPNPRQAAVTYDWLDGTGVLVSTLRYTWTMNPGSGGWYALTTSAVAPDGAASLRVSVTVSLLTTIGPVYVDAVSVTPGGRAVIADPVPGTFSATISVQGLTLGGYAYWKLLRVDEDGTMTPVRGTSGDLVQVPITGDVAVMEDYEAPLGVPVRYYVQVWTTSSSTRSTMSEPIVIPEPSPTDVVLKDPLQPARQTTAVVAKGGQPQWVRKARQGINAVRGRIRPIVISDIRTGREGTLTLVTETAEDLASMWWMLETGDVLLLQWPRIFGERDVYVSVGDVTEAGVVEYAGYSDRTWTLPLTEVDRPVGGTAGSAGRTWQTVLTTHDDWMSVLSAGSWLDVLQGTNGG